jgi:hypothetical protein
MASHDIDKLIEQSFSGDPPDSAFRAQALKESIEALDRGRRAHVRRRLAQFGLAAAFLASVSFLAGRLTVPRAATLDVNLTPRAAVVSGGVTVSDDLLAWLDAARFFKQLGMEERMGRALERAAKLRTRHNVSASHRVEDGTVVPDGQVVEEIRRPAGLAVLPRLYEPRPGTEGIIASSLGGYGYANEND